MPRLKAIKTGVSAAKGPYVFSSRAYIVSMTRNMTGCEQADLVVLFETIEEKIEYECGEKIKPECYKIIRRILNDLKEHGKEYIRNKYGI